MIRVAPNDTVWIHAGKRVVGVKDGKRYELPEAAESFVAGLETLEEFQIDGNGRMWFFSETKPRRDQRQRRAFAWRDRCRLV